MNDAVISTMAREFVAIAGEWICGLELDLSPRTLTHRFVSHFAVTPRHCAFIWNISQARLIQEDPFIERKHLLWTLNVLKTDDSEHVLKGRWGADEKTIRKWLYVCLNVLSRLDLVRKRSLVVTSSGILRPMGRIPG